MGYKKQEPRSHIIYIQEWTIQHLSRGSVSVWQRRPAILIRTTDSNGTGTYGIVSTHHVNRTTIRIQTFNDPNVPRYMYIRPPSHLIHCVTYQSKSKPRQGSYEILPQNLQTFKTMYRPCISSSKF